MSNFTNTNVIQLRERVSRGLGTGDDYINGAYETEFEEVIMNEGDMLTMKSCYLDTAESSAGKITIKPDETNFSVSFYHYIMNWSTAFKEYNETQQQSTPQPDGKNYFLCDSKNITGGNTKRLETITLTEMDNTGVEYWGNAGVVFEYVDATQPDLTKFSFFTLTMDKIRKDPSGKITYTTSSVDKNGHNLGLGFLYNGLLTPRISRTKNNIGDLQGSGHYINCENIVVSGRSEDNGSTRTPHQFTFDFVIPQGAYDPAELARVITDKCSLLRIDDSLMDDYPFRTPFLTSTRQFDIDFPQPANETFYVGEDGEDYYRYTDQDDNDFLSGTSEFGLKYDEGQDKFQFETLNNPYYVNGQPSLQGISTGGVNVKTFLVNKNCGIAFSSLSPPSVWYKKMGFSPSICVSYASHKKNFGGVVQNQVLPIFKGLEEGVSMTGTYKGLDTAVYKTGGTPAGGPANPHGERAFTSAQITATATTSLNQNIIYAEYQVAQIKYDYAYYMIEIDLGIQQHLVSNQYKSNKIQSVIGRFYSKDSFTNAYNEGSIPYIHRGKPLLITKARVRVLNDDGDPADDIGDNNTIFLELVKNVNPPSLPLEPMPLQDYLEIDKEAKKEK